MEWDEEREGLREKGTGGRERRIEKNGRER
jgi:hypothetical protein